MLKHNYLCHHGVKGMHWGVRRYQNKDGTLTPAGRKKANSLATKYTKITGGKNIKDHKEESEYKNITKVKDIKKMSDDELKKRADRLNREVTYMQNVEKQDALNKKLNPKHQSKIKKLIKKFGKESIEPAAVNASKKIMDSYFDNMANTIIKVSKETLDKDNSDKGNSKKDNSKK